MEAGNHLPEGGQERVRDRISAPAPSCLPASCLLQTAFPGCCFLTLGPGWAGQSSECLDGVQNLEASLVPQQNPQLHQPSG